MRCGAAHAAGAGACPRPEARTLALGASLAEPPPAAPAGPDPLVGTQVGSFRILRMLGRGGMGTVYLAEHPVIGSRVAVKFLHPAMAENPAVVARFYDEARAVNLVGHENIVGIYDLSQLPPNRYFFVMEYLEGETLTARLRAGRLALPVALDVLVQLCDALQCAHERGVVHRDLKPENVFLVTRHGNPNFVKLLDFGIAKLRDAAAAPGHTQAGLIVGTPEYMAPEQCEDGAIDARTDVYALGVIAFELATGRLPFEGHTVTQLLLGHLERPPPRPGALVPALDAGLEAAILRALEKDPARRFQDMASFAAALREVQARAAAPAPAAPAPAPAPALSVTVQGPSGPARTLPATELTRAGLFVRAEDAALPPLFSRLRLVLQHPALGRALELAAEVVRHVAPREAAAWRMPAGFAVQFVDVAPAARAALAALADEVGPAPAPTPPPLAAGDPDARLRALEARAPEGHYALLGLPPDAEFADIRRAARAIRAELEGLELRPRAPDHPARARAALQRLDAAVAAIGSPLSRLVHDAQRGNHRGVARCVGAGVPTALVEARRRALLAADPGRRAAAARHLARAEVARKLGNLAAAREAYERALAADPLDLAALEAYQALLRATAG